MNKQIGAAIVLSCLASTAWAQTAVGGDGSGWYAGGAIGRSGTKISDSDVVDGTALLQSAGVTGITSSKGDTDTGFKLYAGYQFNPNVGVEGGYADLGKFDLKLNGNFGAVPVSLVGEVEAKAWFADVVLTAPFSPEAAVFVKLGLNSVKGEGTASLSRAGAVVLSSSMSDTNTGGHWGLGASYRLGANAAVRIEWERFRGVSVTSGGDAGDVDLLSAGVQVRF